MFILRSIYNFSNHCKYTCLISLCQKQFFTINQQLNRMKTGTVWNIMRARNVYPYPTTEKISHEKKDKIWHAVYLENEYLKVMILPELGGRIQRAYFTLYPGKAWGRNLTDEVAVYRTDDRCIHRKSAGFQLVKTI